MFAYKNKGDKNMAIVQGKCTSCGAGIPVDNSQLSGICKFCGNAYVVEKAIKGDTINTYNNAPIINVNNISSQSPITATPKQYNVFVDFFMFFLTGGLWLFWMIARPKY
jgi:predicted RNA-binding Zn-ribbon protein involved in translation (DUF1610 family)